MLLLFCMGSPVLHGMSDADSDNQRQATEEPSVAGLDVVPFLLYSVSGEFSLHQGAELKVNVHSAGFH